LIRRHFLRGSKPKVPLKPIFVKAHPSEAVV
jgi:hypothetical protein